MGNQGDKGTGRLPGSKDSWKDEQIHTQARKRWEKDRILGQEDSESKHRGMK